MLRSLIKTARRHRRLGLALPPPTKSVIAAALTRLHAVHHGRLYRHMISPAGMSDLERYVCDHVVPLTAPLALISQIERSGGTLLSQLFDGHPSVAAYPHELRFGFGSSEVWPESLQTFRAAADLKMQKLMKRGFRKGSHGPSLRFLMSPRIQKLVFDDYRKATPRDSFDAFFTAFFNAWLDYRDELRDKTLITAFAPRLAENPDNVARFFAVYPDGFLIQVARDFDSWSRSAAPFYIKLGRPLSPEQLQRRWSENAASIDRNQRQYGDRVVTVAFKDLRRDPSAAMADLCRHLGLEDHPVLRQPTFNGRLTWANSSFSVNEPGLLSEASAPAKPAD